MTVKEEIAAIRAHPNRHLWAMIALFGIVISGIGIDIIVPSLPAIGDAFQVDNSLAKLTITAYMIGFGLFQPLAGSVSDGFGRKSPLMYGVALYIICNFLSVFSQDIYQLLTLRFLQGVAVAFCTVPVRAIISDLFVGQAYKKMANYLPMAWALGPIIGPAIGGYLQVYFNWPGPFYFLTLYGLSLMILMFFVPETHLDRHEFQFRKVVTNSIYMMSSKSYVLCMLYTGLLYSMLILFGVVTPFIVQDVLGYSPIEFGQIALLMGLAWLLGAFTNRLVIDMPPSIKIALCFWLMFLVALVMLIVSLVVKVNIYNVVIPIFLLVYFAAMIYPNYFAQSMALFPHIAASANALMASSMILIAGLVSAFATVLKSDTQIPLSLTYLGLVVICLVVYYATGKARTLEV
jgi:DHA1 family bicyclomycin/chloramphenicol resistance-like MFS transporter